MSDKVLLDYGSGGKASQRLIGELFLKHFVNPVLRRMNDGAVLSLPGKIAVSTDTFTVDPMVFPGGDIDCVSVHGTQGAGAAALTLAAANDATGAHTFREQLEQLVRPDAGDSAKARPHLRQGLDYLNQTIFSVIQLLMLSYFHLSFLLARRNRCH